MKKKIKGNVYWVGKTDWELRKFHGDDYSTNKGSTYNSYLIKGEKNVLIDTVWIPYAKEFTQNLIKENELYDIDLIILNHGEVDHSGALPELLRLIPDIPVYCTQNAVKSLKGQYHVDCDFRTVKTGDKISIGNGKELVFVEMAMLHWPDSMATYLTGDDILFSNDAFGQHYATEELFNDKVDQCELFGEAIKYYANILTPFSRVLKKKLAEIISMELSIDMIATSHGVIWRKDPASIIGKYSEWSDSYMEDQITVIYDTMWNGTRKLADSIAEGIHMADPNVRVKLLNISKSDQNDAITEVFRSKKIIVGSPTVNNNVLHSVAGFIYFMRSLRFVGKKAASFGCYGWSGEGVGKLDEMLKEAGFEMMLPGLRALWSPDEEIQKEAVGFGSKIAVL